MKMDISEIRYRNAKHLAQSIGGINAFAEKIEKSQPQVSHIVGERPSKNIGNKIARQIEEAFSLEKDWLDHTHYDLWEEKSIQIPRKKEFTAEEIRLLELIQRLTPEQRALLEQTATILNHTNTTPNTKAA